MDPSYPVEAKSVNVISHHSPVKLKRTDDLQPSRSSGHVPPKNAALKVTCLWEAQTLVLDKVGDLTTIESFDFPHNKQMDLHLAPTYPGPKAHALTEITTITLYHPYLPQHTMLQLSIITTMIFRPSTCKRILLADQKVPCLYMFTCARLAAHIYFDRHP